jgi:hypothetical protein
VTEQKIRKNSDGDIKKSDIVFNYNGDFGSVGLRLTFNTKGSFSYNATYLPSQSSSSQEDFDWSVDFDTILEKNFIIKKETVGNRTRYTAEGENTLKLANGSQTSKIKLVVWEE